MWELDHSFAISSFSLSRATAHLLNRGAIQLVLAGKASLPLFSGPFASLSPINRLRTISLLEKLPSAPPWLPLPFQMNPELVGNVMNGLNQLTLFGYYSEWSGYGRTRLFPSDERVLEHFPVS